MGKAYRELSALAAAGSVEKREAHPTDTGWSCGWRPVQVAAAVAA